MGRNIDFSEAPIRRSIISFSLGVYNSVSYSKSVPCASLFDFFPCNVDIREFTSVQPLHTTTPEFLPSNRIATITVTIRMSIVTAADNILIFFSLFFKENKSIHMECQGLFSLKNNTKYKLKCRLQQILPCSRMIKRILLSQSFRFCFFVLRFYGPVN